VGLKGAGKGGETDLILQAVGKGGQIGTAKCSLPWQRGSAFNLGGTGGKPMEVRARPEQFSVGDIFAYIKSGIFRPSCSVKCILGFCQVAWLHHSNH
jgi:hypothetical protein